MCIHRLLFFPTIFVKNLCHPSHFASLSKHTRFITPSYAMFSSFSQRNYDGGNGDDYSNPVPRILSMCGEQGIKSIKQKTYIRNTLILEGVKFYLDRKCFKESADFFAEQVELYHSTIGLHLLLDFCLRSYKDEAKLAQKYETNENYEEECNQAEKEELIQSVGIESQPTEEEEKQTKEGKWEPAQKVCRHRIIRLRDICMKRLNTSEFIAHLVASLILNGYSDDALIFMLSFSINGNAFFKSLRLWKKQCDLDSLEKFAVILENAYFCHLKIAIDQRKIDKKQRKIKVVDVQQMKP
uniref:Uncharacterized protein n=1 Tax=Ditylenchus dipsaci TaxID=166011 RepID=A0A915E427_9BILA